MDFASQSSSTIWPRTLSDSIPLPRRFLATHVGDRRLNIDASLIQQHTVSQSKEKLIQLQNGCICCTLRGDLLEELVRLARTAAVQYVVIESTGISEPMQVAETFTTEFSKMMVEQEGMDGNGEESAILKEMYVNPAILPILFCPVWY
jgi:hypothetical protein